MNRNGLDRKRKPARSGFRDPWSGEGDDRMDAADGRREQLLGALRDCYGISGREAEYQLGLCVNDAESAYDAEADPFSGRHRALAH